MLLSPPACLMEPHIRHSPSTSVNPQPCQHHLRNRQSRCQPWLRQISRDDAMLNELLQIQRTPILPPTLSTLRKQTQSIVCSLSKEAAQRLQRLWSSCQVTTA